MGVAARDFAQAKGFIAPPGYRRHRREATLLYRLVAEHYPAFRDLRAAEEPQVIERILEHLGGADEALDQSHLSRAPPPTTLADLIGFPWPGRCGSDGRVWPAFAGHSAGVAVSCEKVEIQSAGCRRVSILEAAIARWDVRGRPHSLPRPAISVCDRAFELFGDYGEVNLALITIVPVAGPIP